MATICSPWATSDSNAYLVGLRDADWSPVNVAPFYGSFSGLLAGFCIAGLFWLAQRETTNIDFGAIVGLWTSVLPLSLATMLYYEVGGNQRCRGAVYDVLSPSILLPIGAATLFIHLAELVANMARRDGAARPAEDDYLQQAAQASTLVAWAVLGIGSVSVITMNYVILELALIDTWIWWVQAVAIVAAFIGAAALRVWGPISSTPGRPPRRSIVVLGITILAFASGLSTAMGLTPTDQWYRAGTWGRTVLWALFLYVLGAWRPQEQTSSTQSSTTAA